MLKSQVSGDVGVSSVLGVQSVRTKGPTSLTQRRYVLHKRRVGERFRVLRQCNGSHSGDLCGCTWGNCPEWGYRGRRVFLGGVKDMDRGHRANVLRMVEMFNGRWREASGAGY